MKKIRRQSQSGQTAVEYIMLLAVVVGASYALKTPMSNYLVRFFSGYSSRATGAATNPTGNNYKAKESKGCAAIGGSGCE